jgi:hypothetical protein
VWVDLRWKYCFCTFSRILEGFGWTGTGVSLFTDTIVDFFGGDWLHSAEACIFGY